MPANLRRANGLAGGQHASRTIANAVRALRKALAALVVAIATATGILCSPALADAPGFPDATFGGGTGKLTNLAIGSGADTVRAIAIQSDGKIVLAGICDSGAATAFCAARLNGNGTLDTSFANAGKLLLPVLGSSDAAWALKIQPDGKLVLAGACLSGDYTMFCVVRLTSAGALDPTFNGTGKVAFSIAAQDDQVRAMELQGDGRIVLAGFCNDGNGSDFCAARLRSDGGLDASFAAGGTLLHSLTALDDSATALALQPDGKLLLAGSCPNASNSDFCALRVNADGTPDTAFGSNGKVQHAIGSGDDHLSGAALRADGRIILAGQCVNSSGNYDFCAARLLPDGSLDSTGFGTGGKVLTPISAGNDFGNALALQYDGRIVMAGGCAFGGNFDFCVARLGTEGAPDTSFDGDGRVSLAMGASADNAYAVAIQADGKIVVAGSCSNAGNLEFCVARLGGGPFAAQNCSWDVDGDGHLTTTIDTLIHTRIALGLRGPAVIGGIIFAPSARRNTWPLIRDYLASQCGLNMY